MSSFYIEGRLPSLNEFISEINTNRHVGNKFKEKIEDGIIWQIRAKKVKPIENPCIIHFHWVEINKMRDLDNIYSAKKFILDAMQKAKVLKNDSQKWVLDLDDIHPTIDKNKVGGVLVEVEELEG